MNWKELADMSVEERGEWIETKGLDGETLCVDDNKLSRLIAAKERAAKIEVLRWMAAGDWDIGIKAERMAEELEKEQEDSK